MERDRTQHISRRRVLGGALATAGGAMAGVRPWWARAAQPYAGTTIRMMQVNHPYADGLGENLGAFTERTGIDVQIDQLSFPVLQQRSDLELSSGSDAYDIIQMIFIRSGRWIGAGWAEPLNAFIENPDMTDPDEFDLDDFVAGSLSPFRSDDSLYALPWLGDSTAMAYRTDVFAEHNIDAFPATFDELQEVAAAIHTDEVAAFVAENVMHFIWPNWLFGYGGGVFADPPGNLTPTLDTPEAIAAAERYVTLLSEYSVQGAVNVDITAARTLMQQGQAAIFMGGLGNLQHSIDAESQIAESVAFAPVPSGPSGQFPQLAVHGYLINPASRNKEAAWEVLKWATGKEMQRWNALNKGHLAATRASVLDDPEVRERYTWGGSDLAALHLGVMEQAGAGYMAYRTVPPFPLIGDQINIALGEIVTGQTETEAGMASLQQDAINILEQEGIEIQTEG